jgi:hypothetical protein
MENVVNELTEAFDSMDEEKNLNQHPIQSPEPLITIGASNNYADLDSNYTAYTQLVSEYLANRFGRRGAERLLLNEVTRNQASPRVVKDILDHLAIHPLKEEDDSVQPRTLTLSSHNSDLDDRIMITILLKNLDKPVSTWGSTAILYLLSVLVKRSADSKFTRD